MAVSCLRGIRHGFIAIVDLLPMAHRYGHCHLVISGITLGMLVMAVSLMML